MMKAVVSTGVSRHWVIVAWAFLCLGALVAHAIGGFESRAWAGVPVVHVITLEDRMINPATAEYIEEAIDRGERERAACVVIELDTPGGLLTTTQQLVKRILNADVAVVTFVSPSGAHAGSAGLFIAMASHVVAMSPATRIGAAHPVTLGPQETPVPDEKGPRHSRSVRSESRRTQPILEEKIMEDTLALIRSLAGQRGRNVHWAQDAVRESRSITAEEALQEKVTDIVARDLNDLVGQLHGRRVWVADREVTLNTSAADIRRFSMGWRRELLDRVMDPTIAYLLLMFGFYLLFFEFTHPGFGWAGVLGFISLILAFTALTSLPINYGGLAILVLAAGLLAAELFVPAYGFLTASGIVCLLVGSWMIMRSGEPLMRISWWVISTVAAVSGLLSTVLLGATWQARRRRVQSGPESMIGLRGMAQTPLKPSGKVFVDGAVWDADSDLPVGEGSPVIVESLDGLRLKVRPDVAKQKRGGSRR